MGDERKQILEMLANGKITVEEAQKLLEAVDQTDRPSPDNDTSVPVGVVAETGKKKPKFLCIQVEPKEPHDRHGSHVNIKVPLMLVKAGVKLGSIMPGHSKAKVHGALKDHGIDVDLKDLDGAALNDLIQGLQDTAIEVDDEKEHVRIFCS